MPFLTISRAGWGEIVGRGAIPALPCTYAFVMPGYNPACALDRHCGETLLLQKHDL